MGIDAARELKNPVRIAHDRNRPIKDYASPNLYDFALGII